MNYKQKWELVQKEIKDVFGKRPIGVHFLSPVRTVTEDKHPVLYRIITEGEKINE